MKQKAKKTHVYTSITKYTEPIYGIFQLQYHKKWKQKSAKC